MFIYILPHLISFEFLKNVPRPFNISVSCDKPFLPVYFGLTACAHVVCKSAHFLSLSDDRSHLAPPHEKHKPKPQVKMCGSVGSQEVRKYLRI